MKVVKFKKKPLVIEAVQIKWGLWGELCDFVGKELFYGGVYLDQETSEELPEGKSSQKLGIKIKIANKIVIAKQNDYIVKDVNGGIYICGENTFKETYQLN